MGASAGRVNGKPPWRRTHNLMEALYEVRNGSSSHDTPCLGGRVLQRTIRGTSTGARVIWTTPEQRGAASLSRSRSGSDGPVSVLDQDSQRDGWFRRATL